MMLVIWSRADAIVHVFNSIIPLINSYEFVYITCNKYIQLEIYLYYVSASSSTKQFHQGNPGWSIN